jgi:signal transduction histidine kinase
VAALGAVATTAVLWILRLGVVGPEPTASPDDLVPALIATALLCVAGLTLRTHSSVNWLAIIGAASVATADLARYARLVRADVDAVTWQWLAIAVSLSALVALGAATAYASSRPGLAGRWISVGGIAVMLVVSAAAVWAVTNPSNTTFDFIAGSPLGSLGLVTRSFLVLTTAFVVIGILGDLLRPAERAWHRVGLTHRAPGRPVQKLRAWAEAFADELSPGRARARWAMLAERSRVARDLHADVVPGLRAALADAERGASPDQLAAALRDVLADVEAVGGAQHPIQLEIGGLVPALEWLVERVERRAHLPVTLDIEEGADYAGEPPKDIALTAFHVTALALGNVVRHAPESQAAVTVRAEADLVEVSVRDDGPGISEEAIVAARANGRRGMADMAAEAAACGAIVDVGPGPGGVGTLVTFAWRATNGDR